MISRETIVGDMLIRNIPDALKHEIAQAADIRKQSLSTKAIELLRKGLVAENEVKPAIQENAWDMLRSIVVEADAVDHDGEYGRIMDEVEKERKSDFGRAVADDE